MRSRVYETVDRPSVRRSVHLSYNRQQQRRAASLLLSAPWEEAGYVDRQTTALSSKCGQRHVVSRRTGG